MLQSTCSIYNDIFIIMYVYIINDYCVVHQNRFLNTFITIHITHNNNMILLILQLCMIYSLVKDYKMVFVFWYFFLNLISYFLKRIHVSYTFTQTDIKKTHNILITRVRIVKT